MSIAVPGMVFRERPGADWIEVEVIGRHQLGWIVREVDRHYAGVFIARLDQLRRMT
jgi:hypothetical protein